MQITELNTTAGRKLARYLKAKFPQSWSDKTGTDIAHLKLEQVCLLLTAKHGNGSPEPICDYGDHLKDEYTRAALGLPENPPAPEPAPEPAKPEKKKVAFSRPPANPPASSPAQSGNAGADLVNALNALGVGGVDLEKIKAQVSEEVQTATAHLTKEALASQIALAISEQVVIEHQYSGIKPEPFKPSKREHFMLPLVLACAKAGIPALLVGPAGTGKSTLCESVAKYLDLDFDGMSFGPQTSKADLLGFVDASGTYQESALVRIATQGGLFLGDELDAGHAGVLTTLNMALANGHISTPRGLKEKHKDFYFVAAVNTYGNGASREYVGRNQLDAATLDRFAAIDLPLDEGLEAHICGIEGVASPSLDLTAGGLVSPKEWLEIVRKFRAALEKLKIRAIASPRASLYGTKLCGAVGKTHLLKMLLFKGLDQDAVARIEKEIA